jgi:hypothetical protein
MLETTNKPISYTPFHIIHKDIIKKMIIKIITFILIMNKIWVES